MKCLCWRLTKGSCPEPNEVLDTKVRSQSAALAPTVGYTMVLSRLYLAPKSWWVAFRLKAQSEWTSSSRAACTGQSQFYFLCYKPDTEVISICTSFSKARDFLKVTFCKSQNFKVEEISEITDSCFLFISWNPTTIYLPSGPGAEMRNSPPHEKTHFLFGRLKLFHHSSFSWD